MRPFSVLCTLLAVLVATPALATGPTILVHRDRAEGTLAAARDEVGFVFDALAGTRIEVKVKATSGSALEPEIVMSDPDDVRMEFGSRYRHDAGSSRAKIKKFEIPITGRHTMVVRGLEGSTGTFRLKIKMKHPRKFEDRGQIEFYFDSDLTRFSALPGSALIFKVKGRSGFVPRVRSVLQPNVAEVNVYTAVTDGKKVTGSYSCPELGDYRLRIEGQSPFGGEWKSKLKLTHPNTVSQTHVVTGDPEGTYTDDMLEPGTDPSLPEIVIVQTAEFRLTFSILNPKDGLIWSGGESMTLMMTLQNLTAGDVTVRMNRDPWHNIIVRNRQNSQIVWKLVPNASFLSPFVTFPWGDSRSWATVWNTNGLSGEFDLVATFQTDDARMPQEALHRIRIE